ncbi:unnamed protein product [Aphanomyces euteiches]|nr:hypothetical protein AeRB84_016017 [Aphanomyces euteiches]
MAFVLVVLDVVAYHIEHHLDKGVQQQQVCYSVLSSLKHGGTGDTSPLSLAHAWIMEKAPVETEKTYRLANGHDVHYFVYGSTEPTTTLVFIHGAAGSHNVFKYMIPLLLRPRVRVVAFDVPGNGRTSAAAAGGLALTEQTIAEALKEALEGMDETAKRGYFLVGQSAGGSTAMQIAAQTNGLQGLAILNSVGLRPHRHARPFFLFVFFSWLLSVSKWTRPLALRFIRWFTVTLTAIYPKTTTNDTILYSQLRVASVNFARLKTSVEQVRAKGVPTFVANTTNDPVMEKEISRELAQAFGQAVVHKEFSSGGHMIQKTQAKALSEALLQWTDSIQLQPLGKL